MHIPIDVIQNIIYLPYLSANYPNIILPNIIKNAPRLNIILTWLLLNPKSLSFNNIGIKNGTITCSASNDITDNAVRNINI